MIEIEILARAKFQLKKNKQTKKTNKHNIAGWLEMIFDLEETAKAVKKKPNNNKNKKTKKQNLNNGFHWSLCFSG